MKKIIKIEVNNNSIIEKEVNNNQINIILSVIESYKNDSYIDSDNLDIFNNLFNIKLSDISNLIIEYSSIK